MWPQNGSILAASRYRPDTCTFFLGGGGGEEIFVFGGGLLLYETFTRRMTKHLAHSQEFLPHKTMTAMTRCLPFWRKRITPFPMGETTQSTTADDLDMI